MEEIGKETKEKNQWRRNPSLLIFSKIKSLTKSIPETFGPIFLLVNRPTKTSAMFLIVQMTELLSQSIPENIGSDYKILKILHGFLMYFTVKHRSKEVLFILLTVCASINLILMIIVFFILLKTKKSKSKQMEIFLRIAKFMTVHLIRVYNFVFLIPFVNLSAIGIFKAETAGLLSSKILPAFTLISTILNSYFIINWQNNLTFNLKDHLTLFPGKSNILRWAVILISSIIFCDTSLWNSTLSTIVFFLLLIDYSIYLPYCSHFISELYASLIIIGIVISFSYSILLHEVFINQGMDPSLLIGLSFAFSIRLGRSTRKLLLSQKIFSTEIGLVQDALKFDLLAREYGRFFLQKNQIFELNLQAEILKILTSHSSNCLNSNCECKSIDFSEPINLEDQKKLIMRCIGNHFQNSFAGHWDTEKELSLLNYCAYVLDVERLPNKALNLMYKNERRLGSLKSKIIMKIIHGRWRYLHLKKIKKVDVSYAEIIELERETQNLEKETNSFLLRLLEFMVRANRLPREKDMGLQAKSCLSRGWELSEDLLHIKKKLLDNLSKNPENVRLTRIAVKINILFDEHEEFMNNIRQIELQRMAKIRKREKLAIGDSKFEDIFNPNSGVIFINMSNSLGRIEKVSTSMLRMFSCSREEIEGQKINNYMPEIFSNKHDEILKKFIISDNLALKRERNIYLFALDKQKYALNVTINICVDSFFENSFMVSGLITKNMDQQNFLICDEYGQILNTSKELDCELGLRKHMKGKKSWGFNICHFIPQLFWSFFPEEGKEDVHLFDTPNDFLEKKILFVSPELFENSKRKAYSIFSATMQNEVSIATTNSSPLKRRKRALSTSPRRGIDVGNNVWKNILNSFEIPATFYLIKIRIKIMKFYQEELKLANISFLNIKKLTDLGMIEHYKKTKLKRFLLHMNGDSFTNDIQSKNFKSINENQNYLNSIRSEENLYEPDDDHSPKLKNHMKFNPVKLPNNASAFSQMRSLIAPTVAVSSVKAEIIPKEIQVISFSNEVEAPSSNKPLPEVLEKHLSQIKSKESTNKKTAQPSINLIDSNLASKVNLSLFEDRLIDYKSENSSSLSNGKARAMRDMLSLNSAKEMNVLYMIKGLLYATFIILMFFIWNFNTNSMKTVNEELQSSNLLKDLMIPISFLIKDNIISEYQYKYLTSDLGLKKNKELCHFLSSVKPFLIESMNHQYFKLINSPFVEVLLLKRKVSISYPGFNSLHTSATLDLKLAYSILQNDINNLKAGFQPNGPEKISLELFIKNYIHFIKAFIAIFDDIIDSINNELNRILNVKLLAMVSVVCSLLIIYAYAFRCALKIKLNSQNVALALANFDKKIINRKLNEIVTLLKDFYPNSDHEVRVLLGDVLAESVGNIQKRAKILDKAKPVKNNELDPLTLPNSLLSNQKEKTAKRFPVMSVKVFLIFSLTCLSLIFVIPVLTFLVNDFILKEFNEKVSKILMIKEGTQKFTVSLIAVNTLKQAEFRLKLEPQTASITALQAEIKEYVNLLTQNLKKESDSLKIVDREDGYPELMSLISEFFLSDICKGLKGANINLDLTNSFNSSLCENALRGSLKRGVKTLYLEIINLFYEWDSKMVSEEPEDAFMKTILPTQGFSDLQFSLYLVHLFEEKLHPAYKSVLEKYLNPFNKQEDVWLGVGLSFIFISFFLVWSLLILSLKNVYQSSISMLRNFPIKMILSNKILLARIDQLFKSKGRRNWNLFK